VVPSAPVVAVNAAPLVMSPTAVMSPVPEMAVVVCQESAPLPSVVSTWFAEPSALGSVQVTFEETVAGDWMAT
jgi:hypothetical protein